VPDITSARNPQIADAIGLHRSRERRSRRLTLLEGPHLLSAAIAAAAAIEVVYADEDDATTRQAAGEAGLALRTVDERVLSRLAPSEHPRGPVAVMAIPPFEAPGGGDTLVLVEVADPGNAGTLLRSALAFGFDVAVTPGTVDLWSPKVLRAGAGAHFALRLSLVGSDPVEELRSSGVRIVAAGPRGGGDPSELEGDAVGLLVGNEPRGLSEDLMLRTDAVVTIPTAAGVESLNAAVAGSILMYERARARHGARQ
jgi:TrmH family RNA methyltransferase